MARASGERRAAALAAVALLVAGGWARGGPLAGVCGPPDAWVRLIDAHVARYPSMEIADAYKLLHQATLGSEHAVTSREAAREWLAEEIRGLGDGPPEPLVDPLGSDSLVARIHLRPFLDAGGSPERLVDAFVETAARMVGDAAELECALQALRTESALGRWPWSPAEAEAYLRTRRSEGWPAVHHSRVFSASYRPAYRVVAVGLVPDAIEGTKP